MSLILTLNAGSSSLKFGVFTNEDAPEEITGGQVERIGGKARIEIEKGGIEHGEDIDAPDHQAAAAAIMAALDKTLAGRALAGIGHRVVHGGPNFGADAVITDAVVDQIAELVPLAPLHQPNNLATIKGTRALFPGAMQVACFGTAFHLGKPFVHDTYGLPRRFYEAGVRRYGFHGLSYTYIRSALMAEDPAVAKGRVIIAHLGNGASLAAMKEGKSVATTMGFSALDGLAMGTRPGQIDAGVILYLMREHGMDYDALTQMLYRESGLKGISGLSNDMRVLLGSEAQEAAEAVAYFVARLQREIGSSTAALSGLDTLVFTGGIGENSDVIRARVLENLGYLGIILDPEANAESASVISAPDSAVTVRVIPTNEELVIARAVREELVAAGR